MKIRLIVPALSLALVSSLSLADDCGSVFWRDFHGSRLYQLGGGSAYYFVSDHVAIDADGAPNAYHPGDIGLDKLANAGYPNQSWWKDVLVVDPDDSTQPYVQASGEFKGYFIAKTALIDRTKKATDPARYVDARHVPYLVFPGSFYKLEGTGGLGDIGVAVNIRRERTSPFVVGDIGPFQAKLGEMSINLAERLSGQIVNPRTGKGTPVGDNLYILFPFSGQRHRWPLSYSDMENLTSEYLERHGGLEQILDCALSH